MPTPQYRAELPVLAGEAWEGTGLGVCRGCPRPPHDSYYPLGSARGRDACSCIFSWPLCQEAVSSEFSYGISGIGCVTVQEDMQGRVHSPAALTKCQADSHVLLGVSSLAFHVEFKGIRD